MIEINRSEHMLKNILFVIEQMDDEFKIRDYIVKIEPRTYAQMGTYTRCINDLKLLSQTDIRGEKYINQAKEICKYYLEYATGKKYSATKVANDYRKQHYKQLNVDIPKEIMEDFELCLKERGEIKKQVILQFIKDYISEKNENSN